MDIQKQVNSVEQGKRLQELGITVNGYFSWFGERGHKLLDMGSEGVAVKEWLYIAATVPVNNMDADHRNDIGQQTPLYPAFTVAEISEMLPYENILYWKMAGGSFTCSKDVVIQNSTDCVKNVYAETLAECLAAMLIYLLENGHVTAAECNERLSK